MRRWFVLILVLALLTGCARFKVRMWNDARTKPVKEWTTELVYVGTGTLLDLFCNLGFYLLDYVVQQPHLRASVGTGFLVNLPFLRGPEAVEWVDFTNRDGHNISLVGFPLTIERLAPDVNFSTSD